MPTPFPGMDPYLEWEDLWPDVHFSLIVSIANQLGPLLRPHYIVEIGERNYKTVLQDNRQLQKLRDHAFALDTDDEGAVAVEVPRLDEIRETFLEIRSTADGRVITVLEILSPANKRPGAGREQYVQKRLGVFSSWSNMVEIDLLRAGEPMQVLGWSGRSDYCILLSRGRRINATLQPFSVRRAIPRFALPLLKGDDEPTVDLGALLHALYDRAGNDLRIDYGGEAEPPLAGADAAWADELR